MDGTHLAGEGSYQGGDGISQVGVRLVDGTCLAGEGSYGGGNGISQVGVGLVNDWVGMWMGHVLQGRDPIKGLMG